MKLRTFTRDDFDAIHDCFVDAFGDYSVPLAMSRGALFEMITRRGYDPALSVGAFEDDRLIGFVLNGRGEWRGQTTAYDTGTGVRQSHRSSGLGKTLVAEALGVLRREHIGLYLLEVLQENTAAIRLYEASGFEKKRDLRCFTVSSAAVDRPDAIEEVPALDWNLVTTWCNFPPSWQNGTESIQRAGAPRTLLAAVAEGQIAGYCVVFPETNDLAQLAVDPRHRRRGLGSALLAAAAARVNGPLRILNVDARDEASLGFLENAGAAELTRQWEMELELG